jgi:hypothetical protein
LPIVWHKTFLPFERRGDSWETLLKWFEDETGSKIIFHDPVPSGKFTFINPRDRSGNMRLYSLVDVFDIINEILQGSTKHTLLRNGNILALIAADGSLPNWQFPRVEPADLPNHGKTEVVETIIDLGNRAQASDLVAGQCKRLVGPLADLTPIGNGRYLMRGPVASLMLVFELTKQ